MSKDTADYMKVDSRSKNIQDEGESILESISRKEDESIKE